MSRFENIPSEPYWQRLQSLRSAKIQSELMLAEAQ